MMIQMFELNSISYKESRIEYFRAQKAHCERCLDYWANALCKGKRGYSQIMLEDKCAAYGEMINFYEDAINALGGEFNGRSDQPFGII